MANGTGSDGSGSRVVLRHADKAIFVAVLGWCSSAAMGAVGTPAEVERARAQSPILAAIDAHMTTASVVPPPSAPRWCETLEEQLDPRRVPPARPLPAWLVERRPVFLFTVPPEDPPLEVAHRPGAVTGVEATSRYAARLTIAPARGAYVLITQVLERRAGEGPWVRVKEVPAGAPEVTDVALAPRTRYTWRVVSTATLDRDDPEVEEALRRGRVALELAPEVARVEGEASAEHLTPVDCHIVPSSIELDPLHPERATAQVFVHRWNPVAGRFDRASQRVQVGGAVGDAVLVEVGTAKRPHPQFGWEQVIEWIKVRDADGAERVLNNQDIPDEVKKRK